MRGTELIKDGGLFVCQHCGVKYTLEEARKLMDDGLVEVKIDNSEKLQKLTRIACSAKDSKNYAEAVKYYEMIFHEDPTNWEAAFYRIYYTVYRSALDDIPLNTSTIIADAKSALFLIEQIDDPGERDSAASQIANSVNELAARYRTMIDNQSISRRHVRFKLAIHKMTYQIAEYLHRSAILNGELTVLAKTNLYKRGISIVASEPYLYYMKQEVMDRETERIRAYDPQYNPPES